MKRLSTRSHDVVRAIADRENFSTYGALAGRWTLDSTGQLCKDHRLLLEQHRGTGPIYVVYSYVTPIAWFTDAHGWIVPDARYSVTTSRHQGKLYAIRDRVSA